MSKKTSINTIDIETNIMAKVRSNEIVMKPKWFFILGSILMLAGLIGFSLVAIFFTNLILFMLQKHGPMGQWRIQQMLQEFPWWVLILALIGIGLGVFLLQKFDFAYRKNFWLILFGFITSIVIAAYLIDYFGLNELWSHRGPMRRFYQQLENQRHQFRYR